MTWRPLLAALLVLLFSAPARAAWPERAITLIVPWIEGSGSDAIARALAPLLAQQLGQPLRIENRIGKSGSIGFTAIAAAAPDGYTLGLVTTELAMLHWQDVTPLTFRDFRLIGQVNADPAVLQVRTDVRFQSAAQLVALARSHPGNLRASGTGQGGIWHLALGGLLQAAGVGPNSIAWVPSQGAGPALQDLLGGSIDVVVCSSVDARKAVEARQVTALAVLDPVRHPSLPEVPTLREATGIDWSAAVWRAVAAPKALPPEIAARLGAALQATYETPDFQAFLARRGFGPTWRDAAALEAFLARADEDYGRLMKQLGLIK